MAVQEVPNLDRRQREYRRQERRWPSPRLIEPRSRCVRWRPKSPMMDPWSAESFSSSLPSRPVGAPPSKLAMQRTTPSLGDAVGLGLANEGEAGRHAEELQLLLEVLGHEGTAVVVAQRHPSRGIGADGAEDLADGERQRRGGGVAIALFGDVPAETLGVPVFGDDEQRDVAVLDRRDDGAVGGASVVIEPSWSFAGRGGRRCGESRLFSPMIRSTRLRPTRMPSITRSRAQTLRCPSPAHGERARSWRMAASRILVAVPRFRTASAGRALLWPSLLASAVVERGSRNAPDRADPLHAIRLAGRRRGRGGHQRDLLRAKGPGLQFLCPSLWRFLIRQCRVHRNRVQLIFHCLVIAACGAANDGAKVDFFVNEQNGAEIGRRCCKP